MVLFLQPVFQERIWGGRALQQQFNYDIPSHTTGECWAISAHQMVRTLLKTDCIKERLWTQVWDEDRALFGEINAANFHC